MKARTALGLPGRYQAEEHSLQATLLCQYQSQWQQHDGLLCYCMHLYVQTAVRDCTEVLRLLNDDPIAGDFSAKCTLELMFRKYYWPGMLRRVKAYTWACSTCQRICPERHRPHRSMEQLPQPRGPWTDISMDFIVGLPESRLKCHKKPYNTILVAVDWYTKQARYFPSHDLLDLIDLAELILRKLVLRRALIPQSIMSDRGRQLTFK